MNLLSIPFFQSSTDPTKLSKTISGLIISSSSIIILVASIGLHTTVSTNQIASFADQVAQTVSAIGVAVGLIHSLYGATLKIVNAVVSAFKGTPTTQA